MNEFYEVGTCGKYAEGFQPFIRVLDLGVAEKVKTFVEQLQDRVPVELWGLPDNEEQELTKLCFALDEECSQKLGVKFNVSLYSKDMYEIKVIKRTIIQPIGF